MYKNILVPVEPSHIEKHRAALEMAQVLAEKGEAQITAVTVIEPMPGYFAMADDLEHLETKAAKALFKELRDFVGDKAEIKTEILHGHPASEINAYAEANKVDCIVIASHMPGFSDYFLGSTAARVVRHAHCAVHVMR